MKNIYELKTYIVVNQIEYEKLKSLTNNYNSFEFCGCCGFGLNICSGSCYNIKCEKYLRSNKNLFTAGNEYSVPIVKRLLLYDSEVLKIEDNLKCFESIIKV